MRKKGIAGVRLLLGLCVLTAGGCSSAGIAIKEQFGYAKRDQLVSEVADARDEQQAAKKQFESALDEFLAVTRVNGGDLEAQYRTLKSAFEDASDQADDVRSQIRDVDRVATALFKEWKSELSQYSNESMRRNSERQLEETRAQYTRLFESMKASEAKMAPVLAAFNDQVLYLKHNLNARAISGLQGVAADIQRDVGTLIREMEASIAESNRFIEQMQASGG